MDNIDLQIVRLLAKDSRTPYNNIASAVGITTSAAKKRVDKLISNGVIHRFVAVVNPALFGFEKLCFLIIRNLDKTIKEQDIIKRISLLGDIFISVRPLEGAASLFLLFVRSGAEDRLGILADILRPAEVQSFFARYDPGRFNPVNVKLHSSDLEIMKSLISDPRLRVEDIAKETSLSPRTVARRLEKMTENNILQFTIFTDSSSTQLTGFVVFIVLIDVDALYHRNVVQGIYNEMKEYLLHPLDDLVQYPINSSIGFQTAFVFASFCCGNISTVNLILRRLESYEGVNKVEPMTLPSETRLYQEWLKNEIDKRITTSHKYLSSSAVAATTDEAGKMY
ncbi:MAG TPA: winged helix-turn-helix transcriptional regulator [Candidatus Nitrosopolaris sp.]|nr:winged helix-turn-helix transcriptional regulator [Candidatus Nitrosopolaris sp.]